MAHIKLIILDFDGTLADTRLANAQAYIAALKEEGVTLTQEEYFERFFGVRCIEFMNELGFNDSESINRIRHRKIELYPNYFDTVKLNTALWDWCQMMRKDGVKVWIASTGHIDNICNVMRYLNIENNVDGILTGDDVANAKPAPDCFLKVMEIVGVTAAETIIFEDSEVGVEAARRSGAAYSIVHI